jgi:hypothetical protein
MPKPTEEESYKMEVNRQVKEIWGKRLRRDKKELKPICYIKSDFVWKIQTDKKSTSITKGKIDNLLSKSNTPEMREDSILKWSEPHRLHKI